MTKNILLFVFALMALLFFVFGYVQKQEADHQRLISEDLMEEVENQRSIAVQNEQAAKAARMEAEKQHVLAVQAMADCEKNKKK
jgi:regulatory protein YycI of two-component signal transduction system YycFG